MQGGYGNTPFGNGPWGGSENPSSGGGGGTEPIPTSAQWDGFDLSGVRHTNDLESMPSYVQVTLSGNPSSFFSASFNIASGGPYPDTTAALIINVVVGQSFTIQYDVIFQGLPPDFSELPTSPGTAAGDHVYFGAWSQDAYAAGFFVSQIGWAYTGEVTQDINGNTIPVQPINIIPGSENWTSQNKEYLIRIIVDSATQLLYIYIEDIAAGNGFQLVAILVALSNSTQAEDAAFISVKGTVSQVSWVELNDYQLSSKVLLPSPPPVANAGKDSSLLFCSILQLDGSGSIDPGGYPLTYEWRLIDAPDTSIFCVVGGDGYTLQETPPTGYTFSFYSGDLEQADQEEPIQIDDVLTYSAGSFTIKGIVRTAPFHVVVEYEQLPQNQSSIPFRVLRQAGLSESNTVNPTFYPDALGFYSFDLRVSDQFASSSPLGTDRSTVLVNVLESPLPKGCEVNASFIFDYLLSFWKQVEDRDRIATLWEALARAASTELYTLWQIEYSKSLRDIQRTFIRRWLHYDSLLPEPSPELTTLRYLWGGLTSNAIPGTISGIGGTVFVVSSPFLANPVPLALVTPGTVAPEVYVAELQARLSEVLGPSVKVSVWWTRAGVSVPLHGLVYPDSVAGLYLAVIIDGITTQVAVIGSPQTESEFVSELASQLPTAALFVDAEDVLRIGSKTVGGASEVTIDPSSTLLSSQGGPLTFDSMDALSVAYIHIDANIPFTAMSSSTAPGFSFPQINSLIGSASGGETVGINTFLATRSLVNSSIREDDLLVIDSEAYRIARIIDNPADPFLFQRIVVKDTLPAVSGSDWSVPGWVESQFLNFYSGLVYSGDYVDFQVTVPSLGQNATSLLTTTAMGANPVLIGRLAINTATLAAQLSLDPNMTVYLARVFRRRYVPINSKILDIPILTDVIEITDTDAVLLRNVDFFIDTYHAQNAARFSTGIGPDLGDVWEGARPPPRLWAEYTYLDNDDLIEANFGAAIGVTQDMIPSSVDYLSAVRGLWYAIYNGPTMADLRIALQTFLGLPFAEEPGTIVEIRTNFLTQLSRILIRDTDNPAIVRSYTYPRVLKVETNPDTNVPYVVGDTVSQFAPLVTGASIVDWVKDPTWFHGIVNQGIFYEVQKYHTFRVTVNSAAFDLDSIVFAEQFINKIKPKYTQPLYIVELDVGPDNIDVVDTVSFAVGLHLYDTPCDRMGASYYFDEPWAAGAEDGQSWRNRFDTGDNPNLPAPVYPNPQPVEWGYDKEWLCALDEVELQRSEVYAPGTLPRYDSVFAFDTQITEQLFFTLSPPPSYSALFTLFTSTKTATITRFQVQLNGPTAGPNITTPYWHITLIVNGVVQTAIAFTLGYVHPVLGFIITLPQNIELLQEGLSIAINPGDVVTMRIYSNLVFSAQQPGWTQIQVAVALGEGAWAWDVPVAGGTYYDIEEL